MRKLTVFFTLVGLIVLAGGPIAVSAQGGEPEPVHLVLSLDSGGGALINRMDWDVNAFAPVFPGMGVRASDYIDLSGRAALVILCTDLTLLDQLGSEVPRCDPYPAAPAFVYLDDPIWTMPGGAQTVVTLPADLATMPPGVDISAFNQDELIGEELQTVLAQASTLLSQAISADAQVFALVSFYRSQEMYFEALSMLTTLPGLECNERRPSVSVPTDDTRVLAQSPVTYVRLGELYEILNQPDAALRNYRCAANLAEALSDPANTALAYARQANIAEDPVQAIDLYQVAIDNYATLGAIDNANALLEICGSRNCTLSQ